VTSFYSHERKKILKRRRSADVEEGVQKRGSIKTYHFARVHFYENEKHLRTSSLHQIDSTLKAIKVVTPKNNFLLQNSVSFGAPSYLNSILLTGVTSHVAEEIWFKISRGVPIIYLFGRQLYPQL